MNQQFNLAANPVKLANAASFLESQGVLLRSRNQLANECFSWLDKMAEELGVKVVYDEVTALNYLAAKGLGGERGKAEKMVDVAKGESKDKKSSEFSAFVIDPEFTRRLKVLEIAKKTGVHSEESLLMKCKGIANSGGLLSEAMEMLGSSRFATSEEIHDKIVELFNKAGGSPESS